MKLNKNLFGQNDLLHTYWCLWQQILDQLLNLESDNEIFIDIGQMLFCWPLLELLKAIFEIQKNGRKQINEQLAIKILLSIQRLILIA